MLGYASQWGNYGGGGYSKSSWPKTACTGRSNPVGVKNGTKRALTSPCGIERRDRAT